jgi:hypothetical protein
MESRAKLLGHPVHPRLAALTLVALAVLMAATSLWLPPRR